MSKWWILFFLFISTAVPIAGNTQSSQAVSCPLMLSAPPPQFKEVDLETSLRETGLSASHLALIRTMSAGLIDIHQFLREEPSGVLLGITGPNDIYDTIALLSGTTSWKESYKKFGVDPGESRHTDKFMETLTNQDARIFFLLPSNLWGHSEGIVTKKEVWWLLAHPDRMRNVVFVLGGYDVAK